MKTFDELPENEQHRFRDLSEQLVKFPLSIATPVYFADFSKNATETEVGNGTGTLVAISTRRFCITNHHVLKEYRKRKAENPKILFQIGNLQVNPDELLVSESCHYDLAVLDVSKWTAPNIALEGEVPTRFMEAEGWPPPLPTRGEFVMFGGYPGYGREAIGPKALRFDTMSSGASEVHDAREDHIVCQLQLEKCLIHAFVLGQKYPGPLTGLSGGPVLTERRTASGISIFELVGIIYEYNEALDVLYIRPLSLISAEGVIAKAPLV